MAVAKLGGATLSLEKGARTIGTTKYATFPGRSRADVEYCLSCKWHGILEHYVICEYTLHPLHGRRDCKTGIQCKYHEDNGRRRKPRAIQADKPAPTRPVSKAASAGGRKRAENLRKGYVFCSWEAYQTLLEQVSRDKAGRTAGVTGQNLYFCARRGRIKREYAERIRARYGVDLTTGRSWEEMQ